MINIIPLSESKVHLADKCFIIDIVNSNLVQFLQLNFNMTNFNFFHFLEVVECILQLINRSLNCSLGKIVESGEINFLLVPELHRQVPNDTTDNERTNDPGKE